MENNSTNSEFENYLRKNLKQVDASPDDDLYTKIADKQALPNRWLKFRRYGIYAAGAVLLLVAAIGIWRSQNSRVKPNELNGTQQQVSVLPSDSLISGAVSLHETNSLAESSATQATAQHTPVPNFSSRVNTVPAASLRFQAEKGIRYQSPTTGTTVDIPANSLVDQSGNPVYGEAELFFREYRGLADYLASGIPMHYADGRGQYYFNSGGMFEVRVSQAGTALKMGVGKSFDLAFSPTEGLDDASLYYLDDQTKAWNFIPTAAFGQENLTEPPVVSEATAAANNTRGKSSDCLPDPGQLVEEPDPAQLMRIGVQAGFDLATGKLEMPTWFKKNPTLTDEQLLFRLERGLIQVKQHRDQGQLFFPEDLNKFFTELSAFKGCYFAYNLDSMGGARNVRGLKTSDYWQRISVVNDGGAKCVITLYDADDNRVQFHTVLTGSTENKNFNPQQVMNEYNQLRKKRQQDFADKNRVLRYFLHVAAPFKTQEEWCDAPYQWLEYFENNHPLMARRYAALIKDGLTTDDAKAAEAWKNWRKTLRDFRFERGQKNKLAMASRSNLEYALRLSNFGIYNYDQIFRLGGQGSQYMTAAYKTSNGQRIVPAFVSVMEQRTKIFMTQPSASQLIYSPGRKLDVIVTDRAGRQFHFPAEKYAGQQFDKNGVTVLTLNEVTEVTQSPKGWAELLDI